MQSLEWEGLTQYCGVEQPGSLAGSLPEGREFESRPRNH